MRRGGRGQATVELALGSLIFVTVLLFGIHFAELGWVKLRTQQAATSALWDTTGLRAHRFTGPAGGAGKEFYNARQMRDGQGRNPEQRAQELYANFDALTPGSDQLKLAATRGYNLNVTCQPEAISTLPGGARFDNLRAAYDNPRFRRGAVDGMGCNARAQVGVFGIPRNFVDQGSRGFFQVGHVLRPSIPVCAFGRPRGGQCRGQVELALDDWGLGGSGVANGREWANCGYLECLHGDGGNQAYEQTVKRLYERYNRSIVDSQTVFNFMQELFTKNPRVPELDEVPVNERDFRFVFIGENSPDGAEPFHFVTREQNTTSVIEDFAWPTTPYSTRYRLAHEARGQCFLGTRCNKPAFDKKGW